MGKAEEQEPVVLSCQVLFEPEKSNPMSLLLD